MTHPNWKKPFILAILLFVMATAAYWSEYKRKPAEEAKEDQAKKIFSLKTTPVHSVRIVDSHHAIEVDCLDTATKLCKPGDNSKWQITAPVKLKADDSNANSLLSTLNNLNVTETIELKDETPEKRKALLKEYGLDEESLKQPQMKRVEVATDDGETVLYLGQTHPVGEAFFSAIEKVARGQKATGHVDDSKVYLVPSYFKTNFDHDLTYWRDKKLMAMGAHEIESFELSSPKGKISADRKNGQWTLHFKGEDYPGDIENIDSMLSGAAYLTAKDFVADSQADPKAKEALKGSKATVTLTVQKEKGASKEAPAPVTMTMYTKPDKSAPPKKDPNNPKGPPVGKTKLYATVSGMDPVYELDALTRERFEKDLKDLRLAKLITSMERFTAKKLEFKGKSIGGAALVVQNKDGKWQSDPFTGMPVENQQVDPAKVSDLLDKLSGNRIKEFLIGSSVPTGEDEGVTFSLMTDKPEPTREIVFWRKGDKLYARDLLSKRAEVFGVDTALSNALPWDRAALFKVPGAQPDAQKDAQKTTKK